MRPTTLALPFTLFMSIAVWACSAASPEPTYGEQNLTGGDDAAKSPTPSASSPASSVPGATPGAASSPAAASASASASASGDAGAGDDDDDDACSTACDQQHPAGAKKAQDIDAAVRACTCVASACLTACGQTSVCTDDGADPVDGDACSTCLEGAAAAQCETQAETSCNADAECAAVTACYDACGGGGDDDDDATGAK